MQSRQDVEESRARNKELSLEIASLKVALAESKEQLRRNIEDVKDQKENMTKREIEVRFKYHFLILSFVAIPFWNAGAYNSNHVFFSLSFFF